MAGDATWTFELTGEQVPLLQQQIEWALQRQNQRWADAVPTNRMSPRTRKRAVLLLAAAGLACLALLYVLDPAAARRQPVLFVGGGSFFAVALALGLVLPTTRAWSKRVAGNMLARRAARMMAPLARNAPYTVEYSLTGDIVQTTIDKLRIRRATPLRAARLALHTANIVLLFRRRHSLTPFRVLYLPSEAEWQLLGAVHNRSEEVTGAADGYVTYPQGHAP